MRRAALWALGIAGLTICLSVAQLGWSARGHQPSVPEILLQLGVLVAAVFIAGSRVTGKR